MNKCWRGEKTDVVIRRKGEFQEKKELNGKIIHLLVKTANLEGMLIEMEPGSTFGEAYTHEGEEIHLCVEGEVEFKVEGKKCLLKEGDVLWFKSTQPHTARNIGDKKAIFYSVVTPPTFW